MGCVDLCDNTLWRLLVLTLRYEHPLLSLVLYNGKGPDGEPDNFTPWERIAVLLAEFFLDALVSYIGILWGVFPESLFDWVWLTLAVSAVSSVVKSVVLGPCRAILAWTPSSKAEEVPGGCLSGCKHCTGGVVLAFLGLLVVGIVVLFLTTLGVWSGDISCTTSGGCVVDVYPRIGGVSQVLGDGISQAHNVSRPAPRCPLQPLREPLRWRDVRKGRTLCDLMGDLRTADGTHAHLNQASKESHTLMSSFHFGLTTGAKACTIAAPPTNSIELVVTDSAVTSCAYCIHGNPTGKGTDTVGLCAVADVTDDSGDVCRCKSLDPSFAMLVVGGIASLCLGWVLWEPPKLLLAARLSAVFLCRCVGIGSTRSHLLYKIATRQQVVFTGGDDDRELSTILMTS